MIKMMFNYVDHIIKVLKKEQIENPILSEFLLKYPSKQIAQSSNTIYIGFSEARATNRTHNSQNYDELIDIIITTKQIDYYESAKIYKVVCDIILKTLRKDDYLRDKMSVISFMHKYNSDNTLQFGELLLSFNTVEKFDKMDIYDDEDWVYDIICSIKGYVGEEDGEKERERERTRKRS